MQAANLMSLAHSPVRGSGIDKIARVLVSDVEAAEILGCSRTTIWRRVADGTLSKPVKIGGLSRFVLSEINATVEGTNLAMAIATVFAQANADSVNARYTEKDMVCWGWESLGEYVEACEAEASKPWKDDFKHHQMIGACGKFGYQACETEDWYTSDAYALIGMIKDRAVSKLLKSLNLDKGWGLEESDATPFTGVLLSELV